MRDRSDYGQGDVTKYYAQMETTQIMNEFNELVAEWRQVGRNDTRIHRALTAIWHEMNGRGTVLPSAPELGDTSSLGDW